MLKNLKNIAIAILLGISLIWILTPNTDKTGVTPNNSVTVREENGIQYIHILAKAGYTPGQAQAKANMPTVLEVETKGTYDCSSTINIPQIGYRNSLSPTGTTKIEIPKDKTSEPLEILCGMGMYRATVNFSS